MRLPALSLLALVTTAAQAQVTLSATPLTREQVSAFYIARGFSATAIAPYAQACVLSFEFRNAGRSALRYSLADWQAEDGIRIRPIAEWDAAWQKDDIPHAARIAFRWAQFPAQQEFEAGDWIMGMAALSRRPSGQFRILARYHDDKGHHEIVLDPVSCAND